MAVQIGNPVPSAASTPSKYDPELEQTEIELLLEGIYRQYGFDFRSYAYASIRRRLWKRIEEEGLSTVSELQNIVLHDPDMMEKLLLDLSINVTAMFRDPTFYRVFRQQVIPHLRTYPFIRVWHAGCATGEEVYSMAILLEEEGLYERSRIYATDINEVVLQKAKSGIFPLDRMQEYTENYIAAGGKRSFSDYYIAKYDGALFSPSLTKNVVFSQHNLVTDRSFSEFNVILCRNVLIYFDTYARRRVIDMFHERLYAGGVLLLGHSESLLNVSTAFELLHLKEDLVYRKPIVDRTQTQRERARGQDS